MWVGTDPLGEALEAYVYASCNAGCTSPAGWQTTRVVALDTTHPHNSRFFAVDPQGHPGLVYYHDQIGAASGTYFAHCETNCTASASWQKTQFTSAELRFPALVFSKTGMPRIAGSYTDYSGEPPIEFMIYLECDATCQNFNQGVALPLKTCFLCNEQKGYFDLALDSSDRPRLALYTGPLDPGRGMDANTLYYVFCTTNCGDLNLSVWDGYSLGLPAGVGTYAHLAIDPQTRPRGVLGAVGGGVVFTGWR
jgi:hypothetical protein